MALPKSVIKISRDGVEYTSGVERAQYSIRELTRAALRDVGKFVCRKFRESYYARFKKRKGNVGKYTQYWVKHKQKVPELQVGIKPSAFYGGFQETGSSRTEKLGLLNGAAQDNIAEIIRIESQYLNALENEAEILSLISDEEYTGGADE